MDYYSEALQEALDASYSAVDDYPSEGTRLLQGALDAALEQIEELHAMYEDAEQELRETQGELEAQHDELGDAQKRIDVLGDELNDNQTSYAIDAQIHRLKYLGLDSEYTTIELLEKMRDNAEAEEAHNETRR
jgi:septal ring factor EnvC (AmiA/AmiB activator)